MKHAPRPPHTSDQRLQRLSLWLALMVVWFVAHVLARVAPQTAAHMLTRYARDARTLLVARALNHANVRRGRCTPDYAAKRRLTCRRAAGAALRRALRIGTPRQRANAICAALAAPERWIAHIARRLQRRFTKLRRLPAPRRTQARAITHAPRTIAAINSG